MRAGQSPPDESRNVMLGIQFRANPSAHGRNHFEITRSCRKRFFRAEPYDDLLHIAELHL
jgi:hypothetical protein